MNEVDIFDDEERELDRLLVKARPVRDELFELQKLHRAIRRVNEVMSGGASAEDVSLAQAVFDKWREIHKYVHARPFRLPGGLSRPDQWREVGRRLAAVNDPELVEWIGLQVEVAVNRDQGIPDTRVRRDGPCYLILLEYVGNRKRTALAVLHWAKEAQKDD